MKLLLLKFLTIILSFPLFFHIYITYYYQLTLSYLLPLPYPDGSEFDFIVVGAGSAGAAAAGRLVEAGHDVLLIEAGGPSHWMQGIPGYVQFFQLTPYDWMYKTEPQKHACFGMHNNVSNWPRGKELGGTSMMNYMVYIRGHAKDYDEWEAMGNKGWSWKNVLPLFKKMESYKTKWEHDPKHVGDRSNDDELHGRNGPLGVQMRPNKLKFGDMFVEAGAELGYKVGDQNGAAMDQGFSILDMWLTDDWRIGSYRAYCEKYANNGDLSVLTYAHATKILIEDDKAVGIKVNRFGQELVYRAKKEVIVSGGSIGSPQLLMLSGIGPKDHLKEMGIPLVKDLPVGKNLHDHVFVSYIAATKDTNVAADIFPTLSYTALLKKVLFNSGDLSGTGVGALGMWQSPVRPDKGRPDVQMYGTVGFNVYCDYDLLFYPGFNMDKEKYHPNLPGYEDHVTASVVVGLNRPRSRGFIKLRSTDPFEHPIIDPHYLEEKQDIETLIEGAFLAEKMIQTEAMKPHKMEFIVDKHNCGQHKPLSREYYECYSRHMTLTIYHPVGTCKMAPKDDPSGVVMPDLKVKGIKGLRVMDASIMPKIIGGNTNGPSIMIAEKGAEMIIKEYGYGNKKSTRKSLQKDEL